MNLHEYIYKLLFYNKYVVIPNFGAFVTTEQLAHYCHEKALFYPPKKKVEFNEQIHQNDWLLANFVASKSNLSKENALELIESKVLLWKELLKNNALELPNIGIIKQDSELGILQFEPVEGNFMTSSFGLRTFKIMPISEENSGNTQTSSQIIPIGNYQTDAKNPKKQLPTLFRYAIAIAVFFTFATSSWKEESQENTQILNETLSDTTRKIPTKKISEASFLIKNPFERKKEAFVRKESTEKNALIGELAEKKIIEAETLKKKKYHIVAGAFKSKKNAEKRVSQLIKKGHPSEIIGKNKWGLIQVSYSSFADKDVAQKELNKIRQKVLKSAWLLEYK